MVSCLSLHVFPKIVSSLTPSSCRLLGSMRQAVGLSRLHGGKDFSSVPYGGNSESGEDQGKGFEPEVAVARPLQFLDTRFEWVSKRIALAGLMSRGEAEKAIQEGKVLIDGQTLEKNLKVADHAEVICDGRQIPPPSSKPKIWALRKPKGVACVMPPYQEEILRVPRRERLERGREQWEDEDTNSRRLAKNPERNEMFPTSEEDQDEEFALDTVEEEAEKMKKNSTNLGDLVEIWAGRAIKHSGHTRVDGGFLPRHSIVTHPLPIMAHGLVLLTNDGDFAHNLAHPHSNVLCTYKVKVSGDLPTHHFRHWKHRDGIQAGGVDYGRVHVDIIQRRQSKAWLKIRLVEQPSRCLVRLFRETEGMNVFNIHRLGIGPYFISDVPEQSVMPLDLHPILKHLAPKREFRPSIIAAQGTLLNLDPKGYTSIFDAVRADNSAAMGGYGLHVQSEHQRPPRGKADQEKRLGTEALGVTKM